MGTESFAVWYRSVGLISRNFRVAELEEGLRDSGLTPVTSTTHSGTPPQTTRGDMMDNRLKQQQVREDSLAAVLIIGQ